MMKVTTYDMRDIIDVAMQGATTRLVGGPNSPLLMGGTLGLVYFIDGPSQGFNFVSDFKPSDIYKVEGFPKELWLAFATFLEELIERIRSGQYDSFCEPYTEQQKSDVDGSA